MKKFAVALFVGVVGVALPAHAWVFNQPNGDIGQPPTTSKPNIYGGYDIQQGFNQPPIRTKPNIYGGYDVQQGMGPRVSCKPNIYRGFDCR